jgi:hypothetical protein
MTIKKLAATAAATTAAVAVAAGAAAGAVQGGSAARVTIQPTAIAAKAKLPSSTKEFVIRNASELPQSFWVIRHKGGRQYLRHFEWIPLLPTEKVVASAEDIPAGGTARLALKLVRGEYMVVSTDPGLGFIRTAKTFRVA